MRWNTGSKKVNDIISTVGFIAFMVGAAAIESVNIVLALALFIFGSAVMFAEGMKYKKGGEV